MREIGIDMIRDRIRELTAGGGERPLFMSRAEKESADARERADLHGHLGSALLAAGRIDEATSELDRAVERGWPLKSFREPRAARLLAKDSSGALEAWANVTVDPTTASSFADSVARRLGRAFDVGRWRDLTHRARAHMRVVTLEGATHRKIESGLTLLDPGGRPVAFDDLRIGQTTVVTFRSRFCGPSIEQLPELARLARSLENRGVRVLAVTDEPPSLALAEFIQERAPTLPVFLDVRSELTRALNQWATPENYVLDHNGDVRFELSRLSDIIRQSVVLMSLVNN